MDHHRTDKISKERIERLVRVYHSVAFASEASGIHKVTISRAAAKYNLKFRISETRGRKSTKEKKGDGRA